MALMPDHALKKRSNHEKPSGAVGQRQRTQVTATVPNGHGFLPVDHVSHHLLSTHAAKPAPAFSLERDMGNATKPQTSWQAGAIREPPLRSFRAIRVDCVIPFSLRWSAVHLSQKEILQGVAANVLPAISPVRRQRQTESPAPRDGAVPVRAHRRLRDGRGR